MENEIRQYLEQMAGGIRAIVLRFYEDLSVEQTADAGI